MAGTLDEALENIEKVLDIVYEANGRDGFGVLVVGQSSWDFEFTHHLVTKNRKRLLESPCGSGTVR